MLRPILNMREHAEYDMKQAIKAVLEGGDKKGIHQSCLSCSHFDETGEQCKKYSTRPPARVIAFGCRDYDDVDLIPF